jgi:membrane protease YdiL (CAAX protease family)
MHAVSRAMSFREPTPRTPYRYFALACALTWGLAAPAVITANSGKPISPFTGALAGLSAFGPLLAAVLMSHWQVRSLFSPFRLDSLWVPLALAVPLAARTLAVWVALLFGVELDRWWFAPTAPVQWVALFLFPLAEEFGWRGFVYPLLAKRYGLLKGSLVLGVFWALWHLGYSFDVQTGRFDPVGLLLLLLTLPLYSVILTWLFERSRRNMAVAVAFHAAAHLQHLELAPRTAVLHGAHIAVVLLVALVAAQRLSRLDLAAVPPPASV